MAARDNVVEMPIKELVIERVFDAPRERIFDVFTQPEHLQKWWGPKMVGIPFAEFEARPGGKIFIAERALDGAMIYIVGDVREIERPCGSSSGSTSPTRTAGASRRRPALGSRPTGTMTSSRS